MKRYRKVVLIIMFLVCSASVFMSCTSPTPQGIILISLDDLRADHVGAYGYHRDTSPCLDAFAKESVVFENAVVQAPWTLPSHMSIMTSLYPSFHGVAENTPPLAEEHVTIAELLLQGGYRTGAFTGGGWMRPELGFNQGFEHYSSEMIGIAEMLPRIKKWLNDNKSSPFFLFIHSYDIHAPYAAGKPPYDTMFHDFTYTGNLTPNNETLKAARLQQIPITDDDVRHFVALYDGGIRYMDTHIGDFLSYLKETGLYDKSLIIITSDHGEEFKEHNSFEHLLLYYRPNLHVPLLLSIPGYPKKEIRISELVQSIDIMPTILELVGLPSHPKAQGKSLVSLIKRQKNIFNRAVWKLFNSSEKEERVAFAELIDYQRSIIKDGYQMIYDLKPPNFIQLFNLDADPLAQQNIAKDHTDVANRLLLKIHEVFGDKSIDSNKPAATLDEKTREELKALGYIQ